MQGVRWEALEVWFATQKVVERKRWMLCSGDHCSRFNHHFDGQQPHRSTLITRDRP